MKKNINKETFYEPVLYPKYIMVNKMQELLGRLVGLRLELDRLIKEINNLYL